ncbi:unnamed protein product [Gongylonema pulchrum]|uniref:RDD domain-containing protein n=1 Tax=Gongylonema pulchrum TaxID=637853 RepID=A0A183E688_9BILA|nr:unnamed protein product [Gongylonema pulchrum]
MLAFLDAPQQRRVRSGEDYPWHGAAGGKQFMKQEREFRPSPSPGRVATWHAQTQPSMISKLGHFAVNVITLGYYCPSENYGKHGVKRRWEYEDDEHAGEEDRVWQGRSPFNPHHPTYDLRSRTIYKNQPPEQSVPYSDRIVSWLADIATSCVVNFFPLIAKLLFLPINLIGYTAARALGLHSSQRSLQQHTAAGVSARRDYLPGGAIFRFLIDMLVAFVSGFISFFSFLHSVPFQIAEAIRERLAYALANM